MGGNASPRRPVFKGSAQKDAALVFLRGPLEAAPLPHSGPAPARLPSKGLSDPPMTSVAPSGTGSPVTAPPSPLRSHRPPLVGVIAGVVFALGLGGWTFRRIGEAKSVQADVAARRSAEHERAV